MFYVFTPALVASNLADTITSSTILSLWVNLDSTRFLPIFSPLFKLNFCYFPSVFLMSNFWFLVCRWFMPVNILLTFIIGSALGWILVKITRTPKHLHGLIIGCCSAGKCDTVWFLFQESVFFKTLFCLPEHFSFQSVNGCPISQHNFRAGAGARAWKRLWNISQPTKIFENEDWELERSAFWRIMWLYISACLT